MLSTIAAVAVVILLSGWHLRNRRHAGWQASPEGRFYISLGYPLVTLAVYWLTASPTATTWEWVMGNAWALAAVMSFVVGFGALNRVTADHGVRSLALETIEPATGAIHL